MIITRDQSSIVLKFSTNEIVKISPQSKITITNYPKRKNKSLIRLYKGGIKVINKSLAPTSLYFQFSEEEDVIYGNAFSAAYINNKAQITPINNEELYLANRLTNTKNKEKHEIVTPNIETNENLNIEESDLMDEDPDESEISAMFDNEKAPLPQNLKVPDSDDEDEDEDIESMFSDSQASSDKKSKKNKSLKTALPSMSGKINVFSWEPFVVDEDESSKIELKWFNFEKSLYIRTNTYLSSPTATSQIDAQPIHIDARLFLKNKLRLSKSSSLTYSGWLQGTNRKYVQTDPIFSIDYRKEKRSIISLNEFYYLKSFSSVDFTIGKKVIKIGKGMIYSPSDRISPSDSIVPTNPLSLGPFLSSLDYYIGDSTLTFIAVPWMIPSKTAPTYSRWSQSTDGQNIKFRSIYPSGFNLESIQTLLKFETTINGWDLFISLFNGPNPDPVLKNNITVTNNTPNFIIEREYIPVTNISSGFSTTFGAAEVHGEILKQNAKDGKDDSYMVYMGGFRYTFDTFPGTFGLDQIDVILEYAKEQITLPISYPLYLYGSVNSRVFQNTAVGALIFKVNDHLSFNYNFNKDFKNNGLAQILGGAYHFKKMGQVNISYESYSGSDTSLLGKWKNNNNISFEYLYEF